MRIGIDLMGSDSSPYILFDAVLHIAEQLDQSSCLIVIATKEVVDSLAIQHHSALLPIGQRIVFHSAFDVIEMQDDPLTAIRRKKSSSLVVGLRLLRKQLIDAFVTAGNTGALIAGSTLLTPKLPGIKRPALLAVLPTRTGSVAVIDVGGNVSCKAHHLVQFAQMGAAYQHIDSGIEIPKVGLLNIGVESKKGSSQLREAYQILQAQSETSHRMIFLGNIEGREVFQGKVDVLVTDGFAGNVLLKTSEGVSSFIFDYLLTNKNEMNSATQQSFFELCKNFNYAEYPGAILCGIDRIVMKCHGNASAKAMSNSIKRVINLIKSNFLTQMKRHLT